MISPLLDALLDPKHVALDLRGSTAGEAVWEIVELLRESGAAEQAERIFRGGDGARGKGLDGGRMAASPSRMPAPNSSIKFSSGSAGAGRGSSLTDEKDLVHLIFVIAVPQQMVNDYLICVGALARLLRQEGTRQALLDAATPAEFSRPVARTQS